MVPHSSDFGAGSPDETGSVTPQTPAALPTRRSLREAEAQAVKATKTAPAKTAAQQERPRKPNKPAAAKPTSKPRSTKPASKAKGRMSRTGRIATMVAMAFIAGLAVATSLPANALLTKQQVYDLANGQRQDGDYSSSQELQTNDTTVASGRDSLTALQWGGVIGGGLFSAVTYHNNPLGQIQYPIRKTVPLSDMFGARPNPFGTGTVFHHGIDFLPGLGAPIQAIADGVVSEAVNDPNGGLGVYVVIDHDIKGEKFQSVYAHMIVGSIQVHVGQQVHVTDIVGQCGDTGAATGPHLHFEIRINKAVVDPWAWLQKHAK